MCVPLECRSWQCMSVPHEHISSLAALPSLLHLLPHVPRQRTNRRSPFQSELRARNETAKRMRNTT